MAYKSSITELSRPKSVVFYVSISLAILFGTITLESISISRSEAALIEPRIYQVLEMPMMRKSPEPKSPKMKQYAIADAYGDNPENYDDGKILAINQLDRK